MGGRSAGAQERRSAGAQTRIADGGWRIAERLAVRGLAAEGESGAEHAQRKWGEAGGVCGSSASVRFAAVGCVVVGFRQQACAKSGCAVCC